MSAFHRVDDRLSDSVVHPACDPVEHPAHYTTGSIEVFDFIEDQGFGYCCGQVIKYVARHRHKGKPLEDLRKARWYLDKAIAQVEKAGAPRTHGPDATPPDSE